MKIRRFLPLAVGIALAVGCPQAAMASLLLYYDFDNADAANGGTLGTAGTPSGGGTFVPSGAPAGGQAWMGNRSGANDAEINTNFSATQLSMSNLSTNGGTYTAMAWILYNGNTAAGEQDIMVFGQDANANVDQLHHGIRWNSGGDNRHDLHFGHWGADVDGVADFPGAELTGTEVGGGDWVHVAYQYDATAGTASIFKDGVMLGSKSVGSLDANQGFNVLVGFTDRTGQGSFNGALDEVRIYDEALSAAQIQTIMNIPEPRVPLLMLGAAVLAGALRRRRSAAR